MVDQLIKKNPNERWLASWETNRGCPFSCAYCDWGSATNSKVARMELDRVFAELDWFSKNKVEFNFTPHLTPMFRGILTTIYIEANKNVSQNKIKKILANYYKYDFFVKILKNDSFISTNDVINTNNCHISVCKTKTRNKFVILSVIDNLIKGGSGQGVQNMNLRFGFPLKTGLV